ncbi:MAG: hypothetical protein ACJAWW_000075 [Sulfurimonas sp.]
MVEKKLQTIEQDEEKRLKDIQKVYDSRKVKIESPIYKSQIEYNKINHYICPSCRKYTSSFYASQCHSSYLADLYFIRKGINCDMCHTNSIYQNQIDALKNLTKDIEENFFNNIYYILGSKSYTFSVNVKEQQLNDIYLNEADIPENVDILDIHLTPNGKLFPLELHGNNPRHRFQHEDNKLTYYLVDLFQLDENSQENKLTVMLQWIEKLDDISDKNLLSSIHNYIDNNQIDLIMNTNRALETIIGKICFKEFNKDKAKKSVEEFLSTGATYSHQLNYIINLICKANAISGIEKELLIKINQIRKYRNNIAHEGFLKDNKQLTQVEKAEILATTIVGTSLMKNIYNNI